MSIARIAVAVVVMLGLVACGPRASSSSSVGNRAAAPPPAAPHAGEPEALPADVQDLVERWESCQHWAGEEPYDAARAAQIAAGVDASCPGNDERKAELERRHADDPRILARLRALTE